MSVASSVPVKPAACGLKARAVSAAPRTASPHLPKRLRPMSGGTRSGVGLSRGDMQRTKVAEVIPEVATKPEEASTSSPLPFSEMSYSQQYDELFKQPLNPRQPVPKPSKAAQDREPNSWRIFLSDVIATGKRNLFFDREWNGTDYFYAAFLVAVHVSALAAPFCFSWGNVALCMGLYFVTGCLGITLSYHRQLSHRSFKTPKWLEYVLAYCGVWAAQGDPLEWASTHRYHHLHTDTPLDPHSSYEGFWWSHAGWLLDNKITTDRVGARSNQSDLESQPFYRWLQKTIAWHVIGMFGVLYCIGGWPAMIWGGSLRLVIVYHITWFVNSAAHLWGTQAYNTGDLSRNNWWVGLLAWGEGWHNNHHAFEFSARHGLEWWQFDLTWLLICGLEKLGLAYDIKLPTEKQKARLAFKS